MKLKQIMNVKRNVAAAIGALILGSVFVTTAQADQPVRSDYFSRSTNSNAAPPEPKPMMAIPPSVTGDNRNPATRWFETFDQVIALHRPSHSERVILARPFGQQAERVIEWQSTAAKVAKKYRDCARTIKEVQPDTTLSSAGKRGSTILEYRNLTADWYNDAALVLEDLIRPRPPARTKEELDEALNEIHSRSQGLVKMFESLKLMDSDLRQEFNVRAAKYDDALRKYTDRPVEKRTH